jgi:nucleoside-diphosphate-sugar epimerase
MTANCAPLKVLYVGGTGTISAPCVRRSVDEGMEVFVLNRGVNAVGRELPDGVTALVGDIRRTQSVESALAGRSFDAVVNFVSFDGNQSAAAVELFRDRTTHYLHISTASLYRKPILHWPIGESTLRENGLVKYSRDKIAAEDVLMAAYEREHFPVTIVRPSHTYDDASPPLPGGWTVFDRAARGQEMVVHGDGTSLWTLTHADDFAIGLVGLIGDVRTIGEAFHITSDDVHTWDQIYRLVAAALGVEARLVHVPSQFFPVAAPEWFWSELVVGDLAHSAVFDNTKIRSYVRGFDPHMTFDRSVHRMVQWRRTHPHQTRADPDVDAVLDRLVEGYRGARAVFESLSPERTTTRQPTGGPL